jgi:argininosuccinate lyase
MKLWGGRFTGRKRDALFEAYSESFSFDQRLILYDLRVNLAYVRELGRARVLKGGEVRRLAGGLKALGRYVETHPQWARDEKCEDVHTWVEQRLAKYAGTAAQKLRTGRSRNDLVATDTRLFVKDAVTELQGAALGLLESLAGLAGRAPRAVMPGYTHLQPAQPVLFAHYLLAYFQMLRRDEERLEHCRARADELPLGAGALAGSSFPINRARLARQLGFARPAANSLDVTADRDFVAELHFACALTMAHLSRLAEDLVIFSSPGFGYVELGEAYSTGSSLMPQKKNPDALELMRGRAAGALGRLTSALALLKGLPMAYNRDLQEDKAALFQTVDTTRDSLRLAARVVATLRLHPERMRAAAEEGFLTATDLAEELVRRGTPFARAHEQVGRLVSLCVRRGKTFRQLSAAEARAVIPSWDRKLAAVAASPERAAARKDVWGGTAPRQVARQLREGQSELARLRRKLARRAR